MNLTHLKLALVAGSALAAAGSAYAQADTTQTAPAAPAAQTAPVTPAGQAAPAPAADAAAASGQTIVDAAAANQNLSTLVSAVKAAGLDSTLAQPGPYTVFAPTNDAFSRLAPGTVDTLLKPENKATLAKVLTYHVVPGQIDAQTLAKQIGDGGGTARLTTVAGDPLTASLVNNAVVLSDVNGNKSYVTQYDVKQSNGIVHVVNGVLIPSQNTQAASATPATAPTGGN